MANERARNADPFDLALGQRLKGLRTAAGVSVKTLAELIGVSWQQVSKYEKGIDRLRVSILVRIAKALKQPLAAFVEEGLGEGTPALPHYSIREMRDLQAAWSKMPQELRRDVLRLLRTITEGGGT